MGMVATVKNTQLYLANISVVHTKVLESPTTEPSLQKQHCNISQVPNLEFLLIETKFLKSGILDRRQHSYNLDLKNLQKRIKKNSCNFYFFFTYKTLAIHGNLNYKDFLLCSHFCKRETGRDSKEGYTQGERAGNE
jgi:hypothetical protein